MLSRPLARPTLLLTAALTLGAAGAARADDTLQTLVDRAIAAGESRLVIPPGEYRLTPPAATGPHLVVRGAKNLTIEAEGVKMICTTLNQAVRIENCENLVMRGLTVDYDPLPFTQGTIVAKADDGKSFDVQLHAGYRTSISGTVRAIVVDSATRSTKDETWTRYSATATPLEGGVVRVASQRPIVDATAIGDYAVLTGASRSPHGIFASNSTSLVLDGVTVHASTSFAVLENSCSGNQYRNVRITPGPTPAGATEARLLSSNADGIHSKHAGRGPVIEGCQLSSMGDDGIAINGDFSLVIRSDAGNRLIVSPPRSLSVQVGDRVRGFDEHLVPTDYARIVSIRPLDAAGDNDPKPVQQERLPDLRHAEHLNRQVFELTLDRPLNLARGNLLSSPDRNGSGFVVRNNTIRNHRARGILVKASEGVIEGNTVEGSSIAGVVLSPEPEYWLEADYSRDVVIRNNIIRRVGRGARNVASLQAGAISVVAPSRGMSDGHQNVRIEGNTIEDSAGVNVLILSARGVVVKGNRFVRPGHVPYGSGSNHGIDGSALIWISQSQDVSLEDNVATDVGPQTRTPVVATESATNVSMGGEAMAR